MKIGAHGGLIERPHQIGTVCEASAMHICNSHLNIGDESWRSLGVRSDQIYDTAAEISCGPMGAFCAEATAARDIPDSFELCGSRFVIISLVGIAKGDLGACRDIFACSDLKLVVIKDVPGIGVTRVSDAGYEGVDKMSNPYEGLYRWIV